jgi:hypothetical protein
MDQATKPNYSQRIRDLLKGVESVFSIECLACGYGKNAEATTEWGAGKEFDAEGWRVVDNETLCPECCQ